MRLSVSFVSTVYGSNNSDHPIIQTPPLFQKLHPKIIPPLKLLFYYSNTYTQRRGRRTSNSFRQSLWTYGGVAERLPAYYRCFQTSTRLLKPFPNIYQTSTLTVELKRGLPNVYQPICGARTGVAKRVLAFNSLCRARTGAAFEWKLACDSLCGVRTGIWYISHS